MGSAESEDKLSAAKKQLAEEGWCVISDVISPEKTKQVLDRLWKAAEESRKRGVDTYMPRLDPNESNVRVFYLMELDEIFRELIQHPTAVEMVKEVLGENFLVRYDTYDHSNLRLKNDRSATSPPTSLDQAHSRWVFTAINLSSCPTPGKSLGP